MTELRELCSDIDQTLDPKVLSAGKSDQQTELVSRFICGQRHGKTKVEPDYNSEGQELP